jgi:hypothetical protein
LQFTWAARNTLAGRRGFITPDWVKCPHITPPKTVRCWTSSTFILHSQLWPRFWSVVYFYPEDGDGMFLRNVGNRRPQFKCSRPWILSFSFETARKTGASREPDVACIQVQCWRHEGIINSRTAVSVQICCRLDKRNRIASSVVSDWAVWSRLLTCC